MAKMKKRKLLKLAALLEQDAAKETGIKFDLGLWGLVREPGAPVSCGTTACAMGLAVLSGAFADDGLRNRRPGDEGIVPECLGRTGYGAASSLFNISDAASEFLFCPDCYPENKRQGATGEKFVAARIRRFVAGRARLKA